MSQFINYSVVSSLGIILIPFVLPKLKQALFPTPGGTRTPLVPIVPLTSAEIRFNQFRSFILFVSIVLLLRSIFKPHKLDDIFITLAPRTTTSIWQRFIPFLREPLDLKTPIIVLEEKLVKLEGTEIYLSIESEKLLNYLKSYNSRLTYINYGRQVFDW